MNRMDLDDYAPLVLVDNLAHSHWLDCFNRKIATEDERALERSGLFRSAAYEIAVQRGGATVTMHLKGKHLIVEAVHVAGYGMLAGGAFGDVAATPLKTRAVYRKSEAYATL